MNDTRRIGGWSAVLFGVVLLVAFGLFIPTFATMPADAMQPSNFAGRLATMGGMAPTQRAALALGFGLEMLAGLFMFPALLAVHGATRSQSDARATLALGMGTLGIPFFILARFSGFSLLQLSDGFISAGEVVQVARAAAYANAERPSGIYEAVFWLFFAWSPVIWFRLMRDNLFPRWLPWVGLGAALMGVISTVGGQLVPGLEIASPLAALVLVAWYVGLGVSLLRSGRGVP
jgi:hypothetical protein